MTVSTLNNPFAKLTEEVEEETPAPADGKHKEASDGAKADPAIDPASLLGSGGSGGSNTGSGSKSLPKSNLFSAVSATSSGFVFGQNVQDRVTGNAVESASAFTTEAGSTSNGGDLLFSSTFSKDHDDSGSDASQGAAPPSTGAAGAVAAGKSLTEVAREYEESRALKRKYDEVETFTGEEDEINVLDVSI